MRSLSSGAHSRDPLASLVQSDLSHKGRGAPNMPTLMFQIHEATSNPRGDRLILPEKGPLLFQLLLQLFNCNVARNCIAAQRARRHGSAFGTVDRLFYRQPENQNIMQEPETGSL